MLPITIGKEIIADIGTGDRNALSKLYTAYAPALLGYIYKTVADKDAAENILQQVFIAIWNNARAIGAEPLITWLLRMTRNTMQAFIKEKSGGENQNINSFVHIHNIEAVPLKSNAAQAALHAIYFGGGSVQDVAEKLNMEKDKLQLMLRDAMNNLKSVPQ